MDLFVVAAVWFIFFLVSFLRDRRRLRNGVYLLMALLFLAAGLVWTLHTVSPLVSTLFILLLFAIVPLAIVALAFFLIANGITMMRRESRRPANLLSLAAGLGILAVLWLLYETVHARSRLFAEAMLSVVAVVGYVSFVFCCFLLFSIVYGRTGHRHPVDFIVVLGSRLIGSRVPPLLANRLNRTKAEFDAQNARGRSPLLITSGGQGSDEQIAEARGMADYLIAAGVPAERILLESESVNTLQNLTFSHALMTERRPDYQCLVVTNNFHVPRAALLARRTRVRGQVIGAPTAFYYWPNATLREFVGIFLEHRVVNLGICFVLALSGPLAVIHSL